MKDNTVFCADCEYHQCGLECFKGFACKGKCTKRRKFMQCFKVAKKCEMFKCVTQLKI